ncbi:MAG: dethiobiotin synthase [Gammaproteobacteria bacterium]|mgnify:CR=1 FL=1|nr:MAG: dethiobiotin synthase [Gammaproteobacteria bacterium]
MKGFFITGTDTDAGKTEVAAGIIYSFVQKGYKVAGMKPIASGCDETADGVRNSDALKLISAANADLSYDLINPYTFKAPIAPHIAAEQSGVAIEMAKIRQCYREIQQQADLVVVEGVGGWTVPIDQNQRMDDLALELGLSVIMVVGIRLGCINHTLLTYEAIQAKGLEVAGWVANYISTEDLCLQEQTDSIKQRISAPLLGEIPFNKSINHQYVAQHIEIDL